MCIECERKKARRRRGFVAEPLDRPEAHTADDLDHLSSTHTADDLDHLSSTGRHKVGMGKELKTTTYGASIGMGHGTVRWEGSDELFRRIKDEYADVWRGYFPQGFDVHTFYATDIAWAVLGTAAIPENRSHGPKLRREAADILLREKRPGLKFGLHPGYVRHVTRNGNEDEDKQFEVVPNGSPIWVSDQKDGVVTQFCYHYSKIHFPDGDHLAYCFVATPKDQPLGRVLDIIAAAGDAWDQAGRDSRVITVYGGQNIAIKEANWSTWNDVFLEESTVKAVKDDLFFFLKQEALFRDVGVPYKRGYLLVGPPGNGKTSICRAVATSMPFSAFMFDFSNPQMGNGHLTQAFQQAVGAAPSVFFLEDIDRVYDPDKGKSANVTLDHLLNCLDGLAVNDGLVVIATANDHKKLDTAILRRPGRFDKVIRVDNPSVRLRERYLKHLFRKTNLTDDDLVFLVQLSGEMSMAFVKEIFVTVAVATITGGGSVTDLKSDVVRAAAEEIRAMYSGVSSSNIRKTGFGS